MIASALLCLALNVYHESRGEPYVGQIAVAYVTLNRVEKEHKSVCDVVKEYHQFSWLNSSFHSVWKWDHGRKVVIDQKLDKSWINENKPSDRTAWRIAVYAAIAAVEHQTPDITGGSTFYHKDTIRPYWAEEKVYVTHIGQHIFYKSRGPTMINSLTFANNKSIVRIPVS